MEMADSAMNLAKEQSGDQSAAADAFPLLALPVDVLIAVLSKLDAKSMVVTELVTRDFRSRHPGSGIRIMEQAARDAYERQYGPKLDYSWK